jgi:hypothetical protein
MKIISQYDYIPDNFTGIVEYQNGNKCWYKEGKYHREDGPACEFADGTKTWHKEGELHRLNGPAWEFPNGEKCWYKEGKKHRENGPAIELLDGRKLWYREDKLHRLDGPAIEWSNGAKQWNIENNIYSPKKLSELINSCLFLGKEKGQYDLEWLKFLTENGIEEFPIIPGMKDDEEFKQVFETLEGMGINENYKNKR